MKLSENYRSVLASELEYVAQRIKATDRPLEKTYYYSAAYGIVYRLLNLQYSRSLLLMHQVLEVTHRIVNARAVESTQGQNSHIPFAPPMMDKIADVLTQMAAAVAQDQPVIHLLEQITELAYVFTGNGYYLLQKGSLKPLE